MLGHYKYSCLTGSPGSCGQVVLPLAISFFTFQQIEFLLDTYHKKIAAQPFLNYCLFVTFFPHLIAGPITRHSEMMPQFGRAHGSVVENFSIGITIFAFGLSKKVFLADPLGAFALPIFASANAGEAVQFLPAWLAAVGFSLQLYFDFSGYSDMAIGISRMFGIRLPLNFDSPFKATNIVDFWKRWHLTLTRYINTHLYNPIVIYIARRLSDQESIKANSAVSILARMAIPTILVMTIAGIWHGAGIQFALFGFMHGFLLAAYNFWCWGEKRFSTLASIRRSVPNWSSVFFTFLFVVTSFVFFKASSIASALLILKGMLGVTLNVPAFDGHMLSFIRQFTWAAGQGQLQPIVIQMEYGYFEMLIVPVALLVAWQFPNTQQIVGNHLNTEDDQSTWICPVIYSLPRRQGFFQHAAKWAPSLRASLLVSLLLIGGLAKANYHSAEFLYFQF